MQYNNTPTEDVEQAQLFAWAQFASGKYPELALMYHIPNGGKRSKAEAARFKAQGVKAGVLIYACLLQEGNTTAYT